MRNKILMMVSLGIFILLTFSKMLHHWPFFDESHAWVLANIMNFSNITHILHQEGHPILWFLVIMPFAKNDFFFPYSLYITNYIFCLLALIVMWLKSPFEIFYKIVITFSSVNIIYYSFSARCYSIGIFGMFVLLSLYKNQLKRPILYSIIIGLTAHTNLLCAISASYLAIIFICNFFKNKEFELKNKILSSLIILGFIIAWIYPYISYIGNSVQYMRKPGLYDINLFFTANIPSFILFMLYTGVFSLILCTAKDWETKGFLLYTLLAFITFIKFFHPLTSHHYIFLFLYIVFAFWIYCINNEGKQHSISLYILFLLLFMFPIKEKLSYIYKEPLTPIPEYINRTNIVDKLYIDYFDLRIGAITPYIKNQSIFPKKAHEKPENIKDGYYLTREKLTQYPVVYNYKGFFIYKIN